MATTDEHEDKFQIYDFSRRVTVMRCQFTPSDQLFSQVYVSINGREKEAFGELFQLFG